MRGATGIAPLPDCSTGCRIATHFCRKSYRLYISDRMACNIGFHTVGHSFCRRYRSGIFDWRRGNIDLRKAHPLIRTPCCRGIFHAWGCNIDSGKTFPHCYKQEASYFSVEMPGHKRKTQSGGRSEQNELADANRQVCFC